MKNLLIILAVLSFSFFQSCTPSKEDKIRVVNELATKFSEPQGLGTVGLTIEVDERTYWVTKPTDNNELSFLLESKESGSSIKWSVSLSTGRVTSYTDEEGKKYENGRVYSQDGKVFSIFEGMQSVKNIEKLHNRLIRSLS